MTSETVDQTWRRDGGRAGVPRPGVVVVFSSAQPIFAVVPLAGELIVGRGPLGDVLIDDGTVSRRHARIAFAGDSWEVADLGSRNGTAVDGLPLRGPYRGTPTVVRTGDTLLLPCADVAPLMGGLVASSDGAVIGPTLAAVRGEVARAAASGMLHLRGDSGSGKELLARYFHAAGVRSRGPFVPVNCATIPASVAERLLFGTKKGAYSGATEDADGYLQAADGGVLFLDEVAELDLQVQAKLLRVLETGAVLALGAARPKPVSFFLCSATHRDLRAEVAAGRFRADLFYGLGTPKVEVPPLSERREEIPWLVAEALAKSGRRPHVSLVEACLVRPWPGNVRELLAALRDAVAAGERSERIEAHHLPADAGLTLGGAVREASGEEGDGPDRVAIERALAAAGGNVSAAARALGVHRTQLRRWIARLGIASGE